MASRAQIAAYVDATTGPPHEADLIFVAGTRLRTQRPSRHAPAYLAKGDIQEIELQVDGGWT